MKNGQIVGNWPCTGLLRHILGLLVADSTQYHRYGPSHSPYSHSIVPDGLLVASYTTPFTPFTSLMIRVAVSPRNFMSKGRKSAIMPSVEVTARTPTTYS